VVTLPDAAAGEGWKDSSACAARPAMQASESERAATLCRRFLMCLSVYRQRMESTQWYAFSGLTGCITVMRLGLFLVGQDGQGQ